MKAYGLRDKFCYNYVDHHPPKGWVNWWVVELGTVKSKKSARQKGKKLLRKLLNER